MRSKNLLFLIAFLFLTAATPLLGEGILRIHNEGDQFQYLELVGTEVDIEIHDQVSITTICNVFYHDQDEVTNGMYHFRLPLGASVTGFGFWEGDTLIEYELRPGQQGGTGGGLEDNPELREFLGQNPFSAPVDTIEYGINRIFLRYVELLPYDFGEMLLMYPLFSGDFLDDPIDTIRISVDIQARRIIQDLTEIQLDDLVEYEIEDDYNASLVLFVEDYTPEADWGFNIVYDQEDIGAWLYTHRSNDERSGYFMLVIEPGVVDTGEVVEKYFTFVLDRSGSMSGAKIIQARQAVMNCLDHLLPDDHFNIIDFAENIEAYSGEMLPANADNLEDAREYISGIDACGGTNIFGALMQAIGQEMGENMANQVIFTTDGRPTVGECNPTNIRRAVRENNEFDARIFSFGIGYDVNQSLLLGLSEDNSGISIIFDPNEARIDSVISDFYQYLARPALVNPVVEIGDEIEVDSLYPLELQDVSAGKQLYLYGRYASFGETTVTLSGQTASGQTTLEFEEMEFPENQVENEFVPRMWAKSVIDYWLRWMLIHGERQDIIDLIIELSLEYGILTPYTEFGDPDEPDDEDDRAEIIGELEIISFNAVRTVAGMELRWSITNIASPVAYNIYRSETRDGVFIRLNDVPLSSAYFLDTDDMIGETIYYRIEIITASESFMSDVFTVGTAAAKLILDDPYPNPFNMSAWASFLIPRDGPAHLALYDLHGREVLTCYNGVIRSGAHHLAIKATGLPAGIYLLRLKTAEAEVVRRVVLIK